MNKPFDHQRLFARNYRRSDELRTDALSAASRFGCDFAEVAFWSFVDVANI